MRIIIGCEESQAICKAFRDAGHEAYSCDLQPCSGGHPEWHLQGDIFDFLREEWDMMIVHPPCTYLTVTANKWLKDQPKRASGVLVGAERREAQEEAVDFFIGLANAPIKYICLENPVGIMSTRYRKPDQIIQPFQFGHPEPKKTCLWLKNLPPLKPTEVVEPDYHISKSGKKLARWYYMPSPSAERQKNRSKTFEGVAKAMADQWGALNPGRREFPEQLKINEL